MTLESLIDVWSVTEGGWWCRDRLSFSVGLFLLFNVIRSFSSLVGQKKKEHK